MVRPEGEVSNLDIKLAAVPVHRIRGRILDFRGNPLPNTSVALSKGFGPNLTQVTTDDGTFEFPAVLDGEWRLAASADHDGVKLRAAQPVEVQGGDVENVELRLTSPFTLRGKIVMEDSKNALAPKPPHVDVVLVSGDALLSDEADAYRPAESVEGNLTIRNVYPGTYQILPIVDSRAPYYVDSIRLGGGDALGSNVPILSDAEPLIILYKQGGGSVRGAVDGCRGGHVFLIPQDPALRRGSLLRVTDCDQNGRFEFAAVRPGEYDALAVAWSGPPMLSYAGMLADGELLKQTRRVTVRNNEFTSAEIRLISR
jgi:Carboxypeptidase regulatory-like domain